MTWIALGLGLIGLISQYLGMHVADGLPFAIDYHPHGLELVTLVGGGTLAATFAIAEQLRRPAIERAFVVSLVVLGAALVAFLLYDAGHPDPMVPDGFRGYLEPHASFHRQLAVPMFVTLVGASLICGGRLLGARGGTTTPRRRCTMRSG